jgi:hypothetical protein
MPSSRNRRFKTASWRGSMETCLRTIRGIRQHLRGVSIGLYIAFPKAQPCLFDITLYGTVPSCVGRQAPAGEEDARAPVPFVQAVPVADASARRRSAAAQPRSAHHRWAQTAGEGRGHVGEGIAFPKVDIISTIVGWAVGQGDHDRGSRSQVSPEPGSRGFVAPCADPRLAGVASGAVAAGHGAAVRGPARGAMRARFGPSRARQPPRPGAPRPRRSSLETRGAREARRRREPSVEMPLAANVTSQKCHSAK